MASPPLLEFHNVTVCRDGRRALDGVHLSIALGEHAALLGPNGSGKSTLIKTIARECYPLLDGAGSRMRVLGQDTWDVFALRSLLGIVSNDLMQVRTRDFTAREIVLSGFFSSAGIWPHHAVTPAMEAKTGEVLERLEIPHLAGRSVGAMSSGEARRVLLGRALVHDPRALLLDEPTNSLDLHATHELRSILRKVARSGISIILVTHHLADIIPEIGRLVLIKNGRILADGAKREVLTPEALGRLFGTPVEILEKDGYYHAW